MNWSYLSDIPQLRGGGIRIPIPSFPLDHTLSLPETHTGCLIDARQSESGGVGHSVSTNESNLNQPPFPLHEGTTHAHGQSTQEIQKGSDSQHSICLLPPLHSSVLPPPVSLGSSPLTLFLVLGKSKSVPASGSLSGALLPWDLYGHLFLSLSHYLLLTIYPKSPPPPCFHHRPLCYTSPCLIFFRAVVTHNEVPLLMK